MLLMCDDDRPISDAADELEGHARRISELADDIRAISAELRGIAWGLRNLTSPRRPQQTPTPPPESGLTELPRRRRRPIRVSD